MMSIAKDTIGVLTPESNKSGPLENITSVLNREKTVAAMETHPLNANRS